MLLEFAEPPPSLASYISVIYLYRNDDVRVDGIERADVGQIRFMLKGEGGFDFADGFEPSRPVMINAPGSGAVAYHVDGPFHCFGLALRPLGWGALIGTGAHRAADHVTDGETLFGSEATTLLERLRAADTLGEMVAIASPFFEERAVSPPHPHVALCASVRAWMESGSVDLDALFSTLDMPERTAIRWINHYFGAPPRTLARKTRALTAAVRLHAGESIDAVADAFYDQSHLIREIKQFTGYTPGKLPHAVDPVLAATLQPIRLAGSELSAP